MAGWATVNARKVVACMRQGDWSKARKCPETLAEAQIASLLEVEELQLWSVSKLAQHWGWSRKKARRVLVKWVSWFEEHGPDNKRPIPGWVRGLVNEEHSESTGSAQPRDKHGTGPALDESRVSTTGAQVRDSLGTGTAPRARSSSSDRDQIQTQTKIPLALEQTGGDPPDSADPPEVAVHREWEHRYRAFRNQHTQRQRHQRYTATKTQLRCITRALRETDPATGERYTVPDLVLLLRYAFEAPPRSPHVDWLRENRGQYLNLESLMVAAKLPARMEAARDWEAGDAPPGRGKTAAGPSPPDPGRGQYRRPFSHDEAAQDPRWQPQPVDNQAAFERKRRQLAAASGGDR
ncbi:MAG: hypothetical protein ABIO70_09845 [Pseudomonadota bacterium]